MDVDAGVLTQPAQVFLEAGVVLSARDAGGDLGVEGLDTDLELEAAGRELADDLAQLGGEPVGDHFEVVEPAVAMAAEEEFEDGACDVDVQVEGAIDEFEVARAAVQEALEGGQERFQREGADGDVEGGQAEFAGERAAAGGFDVEDAVGEVLVGVFVVGEVELVEGGQRGLEDAAGRVLALEEAAGQLGEGQVGFAADDVVGDLGDGLGFGFVTDLGSAQDDLELGSEAFEEADDLGGGRGVPDVDAEADDAGLVLEDGLDDVHGSSVEVEFEQDGVRAQIPEVGHQIAQSEGRVDVFGVERGQDDVRHAGGR